MVDVKRVEASNLSTFRTRHVFTRYGEFETVDEYREYRRWAKEQGVRLYILGNGSNTLFTRQTVKTLVLKNSIKPWMKDLGDGRIEASSSVHVMKLLKHCQENSRDAFYFLASVPASVGGALAMNAGEGTGKTIFDFVESVTFLDGDELVTQEKALFERSHRQTIFTGLQERLIVSAIFYFPSKDFEGANKVRERVEWYKANQDITAPSCGSVFREYHGPILRRFRRFPPFGSRIPGFRAQFSRKVNNWIISTGPDSWPIVALIRAVQLAHRLAGKRATPEIIEVP
jgi:UDP-N-acetylmuramate dehydrogenase